MVSLKEYLYNKKNDIEEKISTTKTIIQNSKYEIEEIEKKINELSKSIDTTFEIFSPNVAVSDKNVLEIDKLNYAKIEKEKYIIKITGKYNEYIKENKLLDIAVDEYDDMENKLFSFDENSKIVLNKNIEQIKTINSINTTKLLEWEIEKQLACLKKELLGEFDKIVNKRNLCNNLIDIDIERTKIELSNLNSQIDEIYKKVNNEMFHVKHLNMKDMYLIDCDDMKEIEKYETTINDVKNINLKSNIDDYVKKQNKMYQNYKIEYSYKGIDIFEDEITLTNIKRIIGEAINNAIRHSNGSIINILIQTESINDKNIENSNIDKININLNSNNTNLKQDIHQISLNSNSEETKNIDFKIEKPRTNMITIKISDNGDGFNVLNDKILIENSLFGINFMKERSKLIEGNLIIESNLGMGSTVTLVYQN